MKILFEREYWLITTNNSKAPKIEPFLTIKKERKLKLKKLKLC